MPPCMPAHVPLASGLQAARALRADLLRSGAPADAYQAAYAAYGTNLAEGLDGNVGERRGRGGSWRPAAPTATLYVRVRMLLSSVLSSNAVEPFASGSSPSLASAF